ncbi:hypothetical protein ACFO3K_03300 [Cellulomonas algicola]|uniref:Flavodoxin n=1 Tax=Cellulomonas algicola TaxID=2071633 RepID=A0A401UXE5_9CELL|nr:flavodoxin family protein [Cellulomonas algicola]GCD19328.1 flavodoxin [Cellulomonas algicola]
MTAIVVFESMFGGTQAVAESVGAGIASCGLPADVVEVGRVVGDGERAPWWPDDVLLLVVGGPTHRRGLSTEATRAAARAHGDVVSGLTGLDRWLAAAPARTVGTLPVAAFDTAWGTSDGGSASTEIAERLRALRGRLVVPPETFRVVGTSGGPAQGEVDRAWEWGRGLVSAVR